MVLCVPPAFAQRATNGPPAGRQVFEPNPGSELSPCITRAANYFFCFVFCFEDSFDQVFPAPWLYVRWEKAGVFEITWPAGGRREGSVVYNGGSKQFSPSYSRNVVVSWTDLSVSSG